MPILHRIALHARVNPRSAQQACLDPAIRRANFPVPIKVEAEERPLLRLLDTLRAVSRYCQVEGESVRAEAAGAAGPVLGADDDDDARPAYLYDDLPMGGKHVCRFHHGRRKAEASPLALLPV